MLQQGQGGVKARGRGRTEGLGSREEKLLHQPTYLACRPCFVHVLLTQNIGKEFPYSPLELLHAALCGS